MFEVFLAVAWIATYLGVPALLVWGWVRFAKDNTPRTISTTLSLIGFSFITASALLALLAAIYAQLVRSVPYYDPMRMKIFGIGASLSLAGMLFAIGGSWRKGPVRWHAIISSIGMVFFWLLAINGE